MPTWINHFIVADKIIDRIKNIDKEYFIIGSIAPDCGKQTAPHGIYNPPTGETHFTKDYEYSRKTDCIRRDAITKVSPKIASFPP